MQMEQKEKCVTAGGITLAGLASTALVGFGMFGLLYGLGTMSNEEQAAFSTWVAPAGWATPVLALVGAVAAILVCQQGLKWRWMGLSAGLTLIGPFWFFCATAFLY